MHEQSIARAILNAVAEVCNDRRLRVVRRVTLEVGEFSGVEPVLLQSALEECSHSLPMCPEFVLQTVPLEAECEQCGTRFAVERFRFQCQSCGNTRVRIVRGEELRLISVDAEREEVPA